jgi:uncharacterized membrane protein YkvA (DUF1232 family)
MGGDMQKAIPRSAAAKRRAAGPGKTSRRTPPRSGASSLQGTRDDKARLGGSPNRPLITRAELRRAVLELANTLAPADVTDLLADEPGLRARAARLAGTPGKIFRAQLDLAIACLRDHVAGACPQIPFYSISLLAAGLAYLVEDFDIVPDFIPRIGTLDDALVMALVCQLATDGLRRYCTWKGIAVEPVLTGAGRARRPPR